jgi:hypothetical protein
MRSKKSLFAPVQVCYANLELAFNRSGQELSPTQPISSIRNLDYNLYFDSPGKGRGCPTIKALIYWTHSDFRARTELLHFAVDPFAARHPVQVDRQFPGPSLLWRSSAAPRSQIKEN